MKENPLKIVESQSNGAPPYTAKESYRKELQAKFDRRWLKNPEQFDPTRNCMERERIARSFTLINKHLSLEGIKAVDLGCAAGVFSRKLKEGGAQVDAVDISHNALKTFEKEGIDGISLKKDYVPHTLLEDSTYDLVLALDLIALLHFNEHRLFFSELTRIVKPQGWIVCSTPLDVYTDEPLERFAALAATELSIAEWSLSYHGWHIRLRYWVDRPAELLKIVGDRELKHQLTQEKQGIGLWWFNLVTSPPFFYVWRLFAFLLSPLSYLFRENHSFLMGMEKLTKALSPDKNISHAIFIGKRRPLIPQEPENEIPIDRKGKKQVWE